jgi:hypothetical protein
MRVILRMQFAKWIEGEKVIGGFLFALWWMNVAFSFSLMVLAVVATSRKWYRGLTTLSTMYLVGVFEIVFLSLIKPQ